MISITLPDSRRICQNIKIRNFPLISTTQLIRHIIQSRNTFYCRANQAPEVSISISYQHFSWTFNWLDPLERDAHTNGRTRISAGLSISSTLSSGTSVHMDVPAIIFQFFVSKYSDSQIGQSLHPR